MIVALSFPIMVLYKANFVSVQQHFHITKVRGMTYNVLTSEIVQVIYQK